MATSTRPAHLTPPATITHSIAVIKGHQEAAISVHHARTPDARISMVFNGIHMLLYSCHAAQGLLEAFAAARAHIARLPERIPPVPGHHPGADARIALSIEWTRRPAYAVVAQSALNKLKTGKIHWVDLHTGPITWQLRDRSALLSMIELLTDVHRTAIAVFNDGEQYSLDPTSDDYRAA